MAEVGVFYKATARPHRTTEMYLSHGGWRERLLLTHPTPSILHSQQLCSQLSPATRFYPIYPIQMSYYTDIHNTTFFPTSSVRDEPNADTYPSEAPATEEAGPQDSSIFADRWSTVERPDSVVGSPASIRTTSSCGKHHCDLSVNL